MLTTRIPLPFTLFCSKTQITAAPGCVLYSDYCGLYVTALSYQQQLYVYLFDAYNNPVQLESNNGIFPSQ